MDDVIEVSIHRTADRTPLVFLQAYKANYEGKDGWDLVAEDYAFLIPSRIPLFSR